MPTIVRTLKGDNEKKLEPYPRYDFFCRGRAQVS